MENSSNCKNIEQPRVVEIHSIHTEAEGVKTFTFKYPLEALPGQFVMLWIPRIGMKPFGVSYLSEDSFSVTVSEVGNFTKELFKKKEGDYVGFQGPYGNCFSVGKRNPVLVGGGYGSAPLALLAEVLAKEGAQVTFIMGARTKNQISYKDRFNGSGVDTIFCTDDGSEGKKGYTTDLLGEALRSKSFDYIYTVGPEIMMKKVIEISDVHNLECEASLERYMKCGFGVCGQCCVDGTGERVCKTGPVYKKEYIKKNISEFGRYKRGVTGKIENFV